MSDSLSLRSVFNQLIAEGITLPENYTQRILHVQPPISAPWYVRVFAGFGAWTAALLLLLFLFIVEVFDNEGAMLVMSLMLCVGTSFLSRMRSQGDFMHQLGLSLSVLGQLMFATALMMITEEPILTALAVIILELVLLGAYRDQFHRILSTLWIGGALLVICFEIQPELIHGLIVLLAGIITLISIYEYDLLLSPWWELAHPVRYGAAFVLLGLLLIKLDPSNSDPIQGWWLSGIALLGMLGLVGWQIATDLRVAVNRLVAGVGLVMGFGLALLSLTMPGIAAALLILTLGFWRSNRVLMGLAAGFLIFYLGVYYYSLEITLLVKSLLLTATGGLLLGMRLILAHITQKGTP